MLDSGARISIDGKGCWQDNVFVERVWRSIKYEEVYLHAYDTVSEAKAGIGRYINLYNQRRPHSKLDKMTLDEFYSAFNTAAGSVACWLSWYCSAVGSHIHNRIFKDLPSGWWTVAPLSQRRDQRMTLRQRQWSG